jgi:hypothetical protein
VCAAILRGYIAHHDADRRTRQELIRRLEAHVVRLKLANVIDGQLVGRLRKLAAHFDTDAERIRRHRPLAQKLQHLKEAA